MLIGVGVSGRKVIFRGMNYSIEQSAVDFTYRNSLRYRSLYLQFFFNSFLFNLYINMLDKKATFALKLKIYIYTVLSFKSSHYC